MPFIAARGISGAIETGDAPMDITEIVAGNRWKGWRIAMWGTAAFLLSLPAIAMQFANEVNWGPEDFIVMGLMLLTACTLCELAARASENGAFRIAAGIAVLAGFLTVWVNLAVGMIGSEGNPMNLMFAGVLGIAILGSIVAQFRADRMAVAMTAAAVAQAAAGGFGMLTDVRGGIFSACFAVFWLASAGLFRIAARRRDPVREAQ
jgi:hypothetical protein